MTNAAEQISEQLFKIIKGARHSVILYTEEGKETIDPTEARRFYIKDLQTMINFINDENTSELVINLSKGIDIDTIKPLLDSIRTLANRYIIEYTVKTFGKAIDPKDFAYQAKVVGEAKAMERNMTEDRNTVDLKTGGKNYTVDLTKGRVYRKWMDDNNRPQSMMMNPRDPRVAKLVMLAKSKLQGGITEETTTEKSYVHDRISQALRKAGVPFKHNESIKGDAYYLKNGNVIHSDGVGISVVVNGNEQEYFSNPKMNYLRAVDLAQMNEAIELGEGFSGWSGTARKSINELGDARLIVRHRRNVDEEKRGARTRQIESIFIENAEGERFKFPNKNITAAKAMLKHVKEGGAPHDSFGQHIYNVMEELQQLKKFDGYNRRNKFFENEQEINEEVTGRITELRSTLKQISGPKGYSKHFESFTAQSGNDEGASDEQLNELQDAVTVRYFDEAIADSLPYVARIIEGLRGRQAKDTDIADFARYVIKNQDSIQLNRELDLDDPDCPDCREYNDRATEVAAWVEYLAPYIGDDKLSNMMMKMSDDVYSASDKHVGMAMQAIKVIKQNASVAEQAHMKKINAYEEQKLKIDETFDKYTVHKIFGA